MYRIYCFFAEKRRCARQLPTSLMDSLVIMTFEHLDNSVSWTFEHFGHLNTLTVGSLGHSTTTNRPWSTTSEAGFRDSCCRRSDTVDFWAMFSSVRAVPALWHCFDRHCCRTWARRICVWRLQECQRGYQKCRLGTQLYKEVRAAIGSGRYLALHNIVRTT